MDSETKLDPYDIVNQQLDNSKNKYVTVIVMGYLPNGKLSIDTTVPNYGFLHAAFNEAIMELVLHKRDSMQANKVVEHDSGEKVSEEIVLEPAKKKGRPRKEPA